MKLVEILAKKLSEWPESAVCITQDSGGSIYGWEQAGAEYRKYAWYSPDGEDFGMHDIEIEDHDESSDHKKSVVSQAQWQAERDRHKGGEWKRHRGGKQPVADLDRVEYRLRGGETGECFGAALLWDHQKQDDDVMSYRVISQPQAEEVEVNTFVGNDVQLEYAFSQDGVALENLDWRPIGGKITSIEGVDPEIFGVVDESDIEPISTYKEFKVTGQWNQMETPLKWRDTVNELDAYIEEFTREREALINRLALEGFALLPAMTPVVGVADELPTFRDWMVGDIVEVISTENFACAGLRVGDQMPIVDTDSRDGTVRVVSGSWGDEDNYKFIRRP